MNTSSKIQSQNCNNTRHKANNEKIENECEDKAVKIYIEDKNRTNTHKNVPENSVFGFPRPNQVTLVYYHKSYPFKAVALDYRPVKNYFLGFVLTILFLMLIFTAGINIGALFIKNSNILSDPIRKTIRENGFYLLISAIILLIIVNFAMNYMAETKTMPGILVGLSAAIVCVSIITCYVTVWFNTQIILLVFIATAITFLLCIPLIFFNFSFKSWLVFPLVAIIASATFAGLNMYLIPNAVLPLLEHWISQFHYPAMNMNLLFACTLGYVIVLAVDLRLILGGNAVELAETDFPLGAFLLYIAFADIFIKISQITGCLDGF